MRKRLNEAFGLTDDYDVDAVYNLAPICGECNKDKGDQDLTQIPVIVSHIKKARKLEVKVSSRVHSFGKSSDVGAALLLAAEADLDNPRIRTTFEEAAPAVVQRLSELGNDKADFFIIRAVDVESRGRRHAIELKLNEKGRTAIKILEDIIGADLEMALVAPLDDLLLRIEDSSGHALRGHDEGAGAPDVGSLEVDWPTIVIESVNFAATPPANVDLEFDGKFDAWVTGTVTRTNNLGDGLEDLQGEADVNGSFNFTLSWCPQDPIGQLDFGEVFLTLFDAETYLDGRSSVDLSDWFIRDE
ncbi:hypothetical protein JIG36_48785 [Actinoplanes sp. LDG1-06]|uniref:HNH endonuclease n=1 Tax=Paractinoplanes ovalisporus TaxID=2810368 RepID=A0ABS2AW73_9ACTN|nr:hypothetical protein [Actinoplanes ovalisporus]MBM2623419.1 hypothetical protein [Actinoplanes ovalisporus]